MVVGYIQYNVGHNKQKNFEKIEASLQKMNCDLVVLPELSLCGYLFHDQNELLAAAEAVPNDSSTQKMQMLSEKYGCTIVFGLAEKENGKIYNTAVVVSEGAYIGKYRKIHLSDFEKNFFACGTENGVFSLNGCTIGVQICFDLWFPEVSREQVLQGADLLCVLANFGGETTYTITQTRAIENLTPLVMCNRIGREELPDMDAYFLGKSTILDANGNRLSVGTPDREIVDLCTVDLLPHKGNVICRNFKEEISRHYGNGGSHMERWN